MEERIIASGHPHWSIDYRVGARVADVRYLGHAVDCVQVREWNFAYGPLDQTSAVPDQIDLMRVLSAWIGEHGSEYA